MMETESETKGGNRSREKEREVCRGLDEMREKGGGRGNDGRYSMKGGEVERWWNKRWDGGRAKAAGTD
jgi:hypothetical protein